MRKSALEINRVGLVVFLSALLAVSAWAQDIKIRIAYPSGMNGMIPVVMERAGIAKKYGLDAEFVFFQNGPPMMEALAASNLDAIITRLMTITSFLSKQPGKAQIVASLGASSHSLMVPKASSVKGAKDLKDKRIGVSFGTDSYLDLVTYLRAGGLDVKNDVKLLNFTPGELVTALEQNVTDAIVIRQPQVLSLQEQFGSRIVHTWPFRFLSIMRTDFLRQNPAARDRYIKALRESVLYIANNREQAAAWFGEKLRLDPKVVLKVTADDPMFTQIRKIDDVSVAITPDFRKLLDDWFSTSLELGMIKSKVVLN